VSCVTLRTSLEIGVESMTARASADSAALNISSLNRLFSQKDGNAHWDMGRYSSYLAYTAFLVIDYMDVPSRKSYSCHRGGSQRYRRSIFAPFKAHYSFFSHATTLTIYLSNRGGRRGLVPNGIQVTKESLVVPVSHLFYARRRLCLLENGSQCVMVGEYSSRIKAWDDVILKLRSRLSKWKVKTLSIGGRLTLLKSVLGASPIYNMSIFKVPTGVLKVMESIRSRFFNGADQSEKKVTWVAWNKVLASKKHGGLGVSSFFALNRALLLKWVWRFVSQDGSLWYKVIRALYGSSVETHSTSLSSNWCSIMREVNKLKGKGFDFWSHCKKRIGNGDDSRFWFDCWIGDVPLRVKFPRLFALDLNKEASVAVKLSAPIDISFRRNARGGIEEHLLADLTSLMDSVTLSNSGDRWVCDLVSDGNFRVKEIRNYIDDLFLPHQAAQTRWIKYIPIKVNIFAWRARQDCLPTRVNLIRRGITIESSLCPVCSVCEEDVCHIFFRCDLAQLVLRRICRWWGLDPHDWSSFQEWQSWILSIQFSSKIGQTAGMATSKHTVVMYHYPCPDGAFAALAAHIYFSAASLPVRFFPNNVYSPIK
ncbi:RNA-directed DNA polymerase, eukaryota, partial [Tanacetum coccineum]